MKKIIGICILAMVFAATAETITGKVVGITDGDTITILDAENVQHKVRLLGIDAPEKKQAFGMVSKQALSDIVFGKTVDVYVRKKDRYLRELGKVSIDGDDVNLMQLNTGMAWFYREFERDVPSADRPLYEAAEANTRAAKRGLWDDPYPVAPWDIRAYKKTGAAK